MSSPSNFWINIYKPKGVSSTRITNLVKKLFKPNKVGHAGTLDPLAEGLLPIAIGDATKTIEFFHNVSKTYEFEVSFGKKSASGDLESNIIKEINYLPTKENLLEAIPNFLGKIKQTPPKYSAIKIDGKRAYDLAREGKDFEMKEREVEILSLELLEYNIESAYFKAEVSLGTYIRSLAEDIAEAAGSLGVVSILKRTKYGCFNMQNSMNLEIDENFKIIDDLHDLKESIIRQASLVDVVLDDIPVLHLNQELVSRLRQGQRLRSEAEERLYRIYDSDNKLSLIAKHDGVLRPFKVFNL